MRRTLVLLVLACAVAALWWKRDDARRFAVEKLPFTAAYLEPEKNPAAAAPVRRVAAVPVSVAPVEVKRLPVTVDAVGTVQAVASIQIKSRVDSEIVEIAVKEGALVKEGDLLVRLDSRTIRAQLAQAAATVMKDKAQIEQLRRDLARAEDLLSKRITSEVQRDTAATSVKVQEAQLAADEAQHDNLKAALSYTELRAPVSGRIGSIPLKVGTAVRLADGQPITTVNQIDPIYVSFAVPQSVFLDLRTALAAGPIRVNAKNGREVVSGTIAFVENTVDLATGTVLAKAVFPNAKELLWPGGFVTVQAVLGMEAAAVTVPSTSVQLGQRGAYVFAVRDGRKAELVQVTVARTVGADSVISQGLKVGEQVVTDGQLRLVDGAAVQVQSTGEGVAKRSDDASLAARRG